MSRTGNGKPPQSFVGTELGSRMKSRIALACLQCLDWVGGRQRGRDADRQPAREGQKSKENRGAPEHETKKSEVEMGSKGSAWTDRKRNEKTAMNVNRQVQKETLSWGEKQTQTDTVALLLRRNDKCSRS